MAVQTINQLKQWFQTRDKPTQQQFWDWLDSFVHRSEGIAIENVSGLLDMLVDKADVSSLDNYLQISAGMVLAPIAADLLLLSPADARFVLVAGVGIFSAFATSDIPNYDDTYPTATEGWLWNKIFAPGSGAGGGMLTDRFAMNADYTYTLAAGFSIAKIKIKPDVAETLKAGFTEGAQDVVMEETMPGGVWHTTSIDVDADSAPVDIFFYGATGNVNVIIYKIEL